MVDKTRRLTIHDITDQVAREICDHYCKYPEIYDDIDEMFEEKCQHCPLNRLQ